MGEEDLRQMLESLSAEAGMLLFFGLFDNMNNDSNKKLATKTTFFN